MTSNERFPKGRTYSPPAKQAVVSFLRQARALSEGDAASAEAYGRCGQAPIVHAGHKRNALSHFVCYLPA